MADNYATWRPQGEADWDDETYRVRFERLGVAGDQYFKELRSEIQRMREALQLALDTVDHDPLCLYNDDEGPCTCWRAEAHRVLGHSPMKGYEA